MKVLVVGEYYSANLGDPVLCQTVRNIIQDNFPDATIVPFDMSGKISYTEHYEPIGYSVPFKVFFKLSNIFPILLNHTSFYRAFKKDEKRYVRTMCALEEQLKKQTFDLVVFAGGSIFMDYFAGIIYYIVKRFSCTKAKIVFHACGMSDLDTDSTILLKRAFKSKNVTSISLRDSYQRFIKIFGKIANPTETFDTALMCSKYFERANCTIADFGIGIMSAPQYRDIQKEIILYFLSSPFSWRIFVNGSESDYKTAGNILRDLGIPIEKQNIYLIERPTSSEELIHTVTSFNRIISFRMHSQIIASSFGIPCFGFVWDAKVAEFYNKLGFPNNYSQGSFDPQKILLALEINGKALQLCAHTQGKASGASLVNTINDIIKTKEGRPHDP